MIRRAWLFSLLAYLGMLPIAPGAEWSRLDVDGFTYIGNVGDRQLKSTASDLRLFRHVLSRFITSSPSGDAMPVHVFILSKDFWERYARPVEGLAGVFVPSLFEANILLDGAGGWTSARTVVFHEYTHYYMHNLDKFDYPPWFNEGLAQFLSVMYRSGNRVILGAMPEGRWISTDDGVWLPFSRLVQADYESVEYRQHDGGSQLYPQSWLLVHYLLVNRMDLQTGLNRFLGDMNGGTDPETATRDAFNVTATQMDDDLKAYAHRREYAVLPIPAPKELDRSMPKVTHLNEAEALKELGHAALTAEPEDTRRLVPLFTRVLEINPEDVSAMAGLGMAQSQAGQTEQAERLIAAVARSETTDSRALRWCGEFYIGQMLRAGAETETGKRSQETALHCLERAVKANPGDYLALYNLTQATQIAGDPPEINISLALESALERFPQSEYLRYAIAVRQVQAGNVDNGITMLREAIKLARDQDFRRQLIKVLGQVSTLRSH